MKVCPLCQSRFEDQGWRCPSCESEPPRSDGYLRLTDDLPELVGGHDRAEFERAAAAEASSFWARGRNELVVWAFGAYCEGARSLLEIGCGAGIVLAALHDAAPAVRLVGGDAYRPALELARNRLRGIELLQLDARSLPYESEFDAIAALDVLEHLDDDVAALRGLFGALRPGGTALLAVPQHPALWSASDDWALHRRRYRRRELLEKAAAAGFEVVRATSFVALLLPLMALSRLRWRNPDRYDPCAELVLPRPVGRALTAVLRLELVLIKLGLSFPVGGSLLVVARRPIPS